VYFAKDYGIFVALALDFIEVDASLEGLFAKS
jgi:hypothetical protein